MMWQATFAVNGAVEQSWSGMDDDQLQALISELRQDFVKERWAHAALTYWTEPSREERGLVLWEAR